VTALADSVIPRPSGPRTVPAASGARYPSSPIRSSATRALAPLAGSPQWAGPPRPAGADGDRGHEMPAGP